ncbi:hypothetical protein LINPERHAP1_LOCUS19432 [Linum perenne]
MALSVLTQAELRREVLFVITMVDLSPLLQLTWGLFYYEGGA